MNQKTGNTNTRKIFRLLLIAVLLFTAWYSYRLVLGRPHNINHFANRVTIQTLLLFPRMHRSRPETVSRFLRSLLEHLYITLNSKLEAERNS